LKTSYKITGLGLILLVTVVCSVPAHAIGLFAQWQDSNDGDSGYGLGIKQGFSIIPIISIEPRVSWLRYSTDDTESDLDMFPLEAFGKVNLGMFYGGIGLGYYIMSGDHAPENSVGGFASLGIDISLASLGVFGEIRYLYLEPDLEIGGSVDMSGIGANLGVTLPF